MTRYELASDKEINLVQYVVKEHFPHLRNARILVLMDSKKRQSRGRAIFATIQTATDLVRVLTQDTFEGGGADYVLILDGLLWQSIEESDRVRIIRHELRHCLYDPDAAKPYKLVGHDIEDFVDELRLNSDDPRWGARVAAVWDSIHGTDKSEPPINADHPGLFDVVEAPGNVVELRRKEAHA